MYVYVAFAHEEGIQGSVKVFSDDNVWVPSFEVYIYIMYAIPRSPHWTDWETI